MFQTHCLQRRPSSAKASIGLTLALDLLKHDHIDVQIYEAAHSFSRERAGVGIAPNTQRALKLIGPHA